VPSSTGVLARRASVAAPARRAPAPRPAPRAPLRVVDAAPRRARRRLLRLFALLLLTGSLLTVVFGHAMLAQDQISLSGAQAKLSAEQGVHRQLVLAVAEAETPSRIVTAAEALHMVQPAHVEQLPWVPLSPPATTAAPPTTTTKAGSSARSHAAGPATAAAGR
jgi:hypothetical protein